MDLGMVTSSTITSVLAGGVTASARTCVDWAVDGYFVTGISTLYSFLEAGFAVIVTQADAIATYIGTYTTLYPTEAANYANGI